MGGLHWYHAHVHGLTRSQVAGGAFGLIVVEEQPRAEVFARDSPALDAAWRLLSDRRRELLLLAAYDTAARRWADAAGPNRTLALRRGAWYRLRLMTVNVLGVASPLLLDPACEWARLANDGVFLFRVPTPLAPVAPLELTGASRLDLAVRCNASAVLRIGADVVARLEVDDVQVRKCVPLLAFVLIHFLASGSQTMPRRTTRPGSSGTPFGRRIWRTCAACRATARPASSFRCASRQARLTA